MTKSDKIQTFCLINMKYFGEENIENIKNLLDNIDEYKLDKILLMSFKDPFTSLYISLISGFFAIDRFYIGDIILGIFKLMTFGGFSIWYIIDLFFIMKRTRKLNSEKIYNFIDEKI